MLFSSRRADMRWAAVVSSSGMGLPSAVDGTREVDEVLAGWEKKKGSEWRLDLEGPSTGAVLGCGEGAGGGWL